jgi:hypothetical protein
VWLWHAVEDSTDISAALVMPVRKDDRGAPRIVTAWVEFFVNKIMNL